MAENSAIAENVLKRPRLDAPDMSSAEEPRPTGQESSECPDGGECSICRERLGASRRAGRRQRASTCGCTAGVAAILKAGLLRRGEEEEEEDPGLIVRLECGHAYHAWSCLAPYISSVRGEMQKRLREDLQQRIADMQLDGPTQSHLLGGWGLADLRAQGRLRQCPRCGYGPVLNMNCSDMQSHDATRGSGQGRSTNECPTCRFYSPCWEEWRTWDPDDGIAAVRCPLCRGPCRPVQEDVTRIQAHLQKRMPCAHRMRIARFELFELGSEIVGVLVLVSALSALRSSESCTVEWRPRDEFNRFPLVLADMARCPRQADAILRPLFERIRQTIQQHIMPITDVGAESRADCPVSPDKIRKAIAAITNLLPLEAKYEAVHKRMDLLLCMAISEELKPALDAIIRPLTSHDAALDADLQILSWTESGFRVVPSLYKLSQVLESQLEASLLQGSLPVTSCDVAVQTDDVDIEDIESFEQLALCAQSSIDSLVDAAGNDIWQSMVALLSSVSNCQMLASVDRLDPTWEFEEEMRWLGMGGRRHFFWMEFLSELRGWKQRTRLGEDVTQADLDVIRSLRHAVKLKTRQLRRGPVALHIARLDLAKALEVFEEKLVLSEQKAEDATIPDLVQQYAQLLMQGLLSFSAAVLSTSELDSRYEADNRFYLE